MPEPDPDSRITGLVADLAPELVGLRRRLHAHPELSGQEIWTTEQLVELLRAAGLRPRVLGCGTGLVCDVDLRGPDSAGADGPARTVVLRADIDALAMDDRKDVPYRSTVPGAAHACGHDVHAAIVLGAGLVLADLASVAPVDGVVRLVFEPREESVPGGAVDVLAEGWLDGVDAVFGLHCDPKLEAGRLGVRPGPLTAAADSFTLTLRGPGGHTARPHLTVDLVRVLADTVVALPADLERRAAPYGGVSLVFGSAHSGDAPNVIPSVAVLRGSLRTHDRAVWERAESLMREAIRDVVADRVSGWELAYVGGVPPVVNDPGAIAVMAAAGRAVLGDEAVVPTPKSMGGDSFAWYLEKAPGAYGRLGTHGRDFARPVDLHASEFDVDERAIAYGVRILVETARRALRP